MYSIDVYYIYPYIYIYIHIYISIYIYIHILIYPYISNQANKSTQTFNTKKHQKNTR